MVKGSVEKLKPLTRPANRVKDRSTIIAETLRNIAKFCLASRPSLPCINVEFQL